MEHIVDRISNTRACFSTSCDLASKIHKEQPVNSFQDKGQGRVIQYLEGWCSWWRQNRRFLHQKGRQHLGKCHPLSWFYTFTRFRFYMGCLSAGGISTAKSNWSLLKRSAQNPIQLTITQWLYSHFKIVFKHILAGFVTLRFFFQHRKMLSVIIKAIYQLGISQKFDCVVSPEVFPSACWLSSGTIFMGCSISW